MYENDNNENKNTESPQSTETGARDRESTSGGQGTSPENAAQNTAQGGGYQPNGAPGNGWQGNNSSGGYGSWNSYRGYDRGTYTPSGYNNGYNNGYSNGYNNGYGNGGYRPEPQRSPQKNYTWVIPVAILLCLFLCIGSFMLGFFVGSVISIEDEGVHDGENGDINGGTAASGEGDGSQYLAGGSVKFEQLPSDSILYTIPSVYQNTKDTVVEITTESVSTGSYWQQYITTGAGSGVIIESYSLLESEAEGEDKSNTGTYIVTNNHVIDGANSIKVTLTSGKTYTASLVATDAKTDIAVIRIDEKDLPTAKLGKSSELVAGQAVIVIGNPLGSLGGSVTDGIISCTERDITVDGRAMKLIQTNAAVNPGNSGGAMFDLEGKLIGIVNAKYSDEEVEGIGFAIPIDTVVQIAADLRNHGYVTGRPNIGLTTGYGYGASGTTYVTYEGNYVTGIWVNEIDEGSDSYKAGMRQGDYIASIEFDGTSYTFTSLVGFNSFIDTLKPGDEITVNIYRFTKKSLNTFYYTFQREEQSYTFTLTEYQGNAQ